VKRIPVNFGLKGGSRISFLKTLEELFSVTDIMVLCFNRWKSPDNEFRKSQFKLTEIPTILDYGTVSRLFCK